jgi:DUF4097 and DUF4098 domain-containing protein YvlB
MYLKKLVIALVAVSMAMMLQASKTDVMKKRFDIDPSKQVIIDYSGVDEDVVIEKHDKNEILFTFEKELKGHESKHNLEYFEDIQPDISFNNNTLEIEIKYPKYQFSLSQLFSGLEVHVKSYLYVPANADLKIKVVDGDMNVSGVKGRAFLKTVDGDIELKDGVGAMDLEAVDGDIEVKRCSGSLTAHTVDGNVTASGVFNCVDFKSVDGDGEFVLEKGSQLTDDCSFHTGDGNVKLEFSKDMAFELDFKGNEGEISLQGIEFKDVQRDEDESYFHGRYGTGKYTIKVRTGDGDLTIKEI